MRTFLATAVAVLISIQLFAFAPDQGHLVLKENTWSKLRFSATFSKEDLTLVKVSTPSGMFAEMRIPGLHHSLQPGDPRLPMLNELIEVPVGADFSIKVLSATYEEYSLAELGTNFRLMPDQPSVSKSADPASLPFHFNEQTYETNAWFGFDAVRVENIGFMRGVRMARLSIAPVQYNPVTGMVKILTSLQAEVTFPGADLASTLQLRQDKYSPMFEASMHSLMNYKEMTGQQKDLISKYPIKYVIVADPMFQTALQPFIQWKTKKGFKVIEAYTNNPSVGTTTTSIKAYLQGLYNAGTASDPAPTYILFVGDVAQVPSFACDGHVSDLYYCEYTSDYIPEMIYGRFSATSVAQLQPQIDKTLEYEQYTMPVKTFLDSVVMIAGADGGYAPTYGNGQINYGTTNYFNATNGIYSNTYLYPASETSDAQVIQNVSRGVCFANYTAHGGSDGWSDPTFNVGDVATLNNAHKYPLMVGNCCLTNKFDDTECFGEALLRANLKGALGYIGGSNVSYWDEDYYFGVGYRSSIVVNPTYSATALGAYDRVFHTHGEPFSQWTMSQGQYMYGGNLAVTQGASMVDYYWEIYHLMGDPSLMVYFSEPPALTATYNALIPLGSTSFAIQTDPWGYAAVSMNGTLLGAALADSLGNVLVPLTGVTTPGTADVVITRQNRAPYIGTVVVANPSGPYVSYVSKNLHDASGNNNGQADYGEAITLDVTLHNYGASTANGVNATLSTTSGSVTITDNSQAYGDITASSDATQNGAYSFSVAGYITDQEVVPFSVAIADNASNSWSSTFNITLNAPDLTIGGLTISDATGNNNGCLDVNENASLIINTGNIGHADALSATGTLTTTTPQYITIASGVHNFGTLAQSANANATFNVTVSPTAPDTAIIELVYTVTAGLYTVNTHYLLPLGQVDEDFETGDFSQFDWTQGGDVPWIITSTTPQEGIYCAQSGDVNDYESSILSVTMETLIADTISFWRKVSSESGYDILSFLIDGASMDEWSGTLSWAKVAYPVAAGTHTFTWDYTKDVSVSSGSDCGWIDYILFPPVVSTFTGIDPASANLIESLTCSPNPASGMVRVEFTLAGTSEVSLRLTDITGRIIKTLAEPSTQTAGLHQLMFNASSFESGLYYINLLSGQESKTIKLVITK